MLSHRFVILFGAYEFPCCPAARTRSFGEKGNGKMEGKRTTKVLQKLQDKKQKIQQKAKAYELEEVREKLRR